MDRMPIRPSFPAKEVLGPKSSAFRLLGAGALSPLRRRFGPAGIRDRDLRNRSAAVKASQFPGLKQLFGLAQRKPLLPHGSGGVRSADQCEAAVVLFDVKLQTLRERAHASLSRGPV